ncbi:glycoside hydrolase family 26 protein [Pedobacter sp. SYSU D00535]|uniref:glycoside hydrolase family 26 protein n=1 Tax=Pedobacter sp. SYSU D00535 TaxID=2810308 RepID=UPI001A95EF74|nr:glycosyl hydrolase [Pedobacter sp. SYSU D00535]
MMYLNRLRFIRNAALISLLFFIGCKKKEGVDTVQKPPVEEEVVPALSTIKSGLVDKSATDETAWLFYNMQTVARKHTLFGHQDATKRGVINSSTSWANEQHLPAVSKEKSDVKEVTGSYPVVYGHDFNYIAGWAEGGWFDYERQIAKELTIEAYNRGGINTYSWHYSNPVSKGSFNWNESPVEAVSRILPGGSHHEVFKGSLQQVANYAKSLIAADGKLVPVIFRPFHEMDGGWFWWGKGHCTPAQYKELFQFTVTYLRDELGVRNFLYCWSPGGDYTTLTQYLEFYPGDSFVDILGTDNYGLNANVSNTTISNKLKIVSDYAKQKSKIAAFTETGQQNLTNNKWYTEKLLASMEAQKIEMAYVLVWANTTSSYWTPYKNHSAEADFLQFKSSSYVMFANELKRPMYKHPQ